MKSDVKAYVLGRSLRFEERYKLEFWVEAYVLPYFVESNLKNPESEFQIIKRAEPQPQRCLGRMKASDATCSSLRLIFAPVV